jgi:hypothetical protein
MAKKFLTGLNLVVLDADPSTGSEGELYFNSSASVAKIYQAGSWSVLGAGGGGSTTVSTTEPESPEIGDSWYKNDTGEFYVYDGTYWVEVNGVISLTQEEVQDYVSPLFVHNNHTNITATYDDINNKVLLEGVSAVSGSLSNIDSISSPDFIQFDTTANITPVTGLLGWDSVEGTLNLGLSSTKHIHLGEESVYRVRNSTGSTISKGTALYASGVESSGRIQVTPYVADGSVREVRFMGLATESISNGINGFVQHFGYVRDLDTRGTSSTAISVGDETWGAGDILYVHPTVPGKLTNVKPTHAVVVAIIIIRHQTTGILFVRPSSGGHLEDIHDILISGSVQNNEILAYDLSNGTWTNKTAGEAGLSTTSHNHTLDSLSNVDINSLTDGDAIIWSSASSAWVNQIAQGGATTTVSETAPATPSTGDSWYKPSNGSFFIYDGSYWVEVTSVITMSDEEAQDKVAPLFDHANHVNITASYDDANNQIILTSSATPDLSAYLTQSSASTIYATKAELDNIDLSSASAAAVAAIVDSAPSTLNTLNELAAALGDDANYASTVTTALGTKAPLASPTFTGSVTIGEAITKTTSTALTSASVTTIATFPGSPGLSAECMVVFSSESSGAQTTSKVLIVGSADEGTVDMTEYAIIERGGILEEPIQTTLSASFSGGNIVLRAAAVNYQAVNVKVVSTHILSPLGAT